MGQLSAWFAANIWFTHLILFVIGYSGVMITARLLRDGWHQRRIRRLSRRYTNPADVQRMLNQIPWEGETIEQLRFSFGHSLRRADRHYGAGTLRVPRAPKEDYIISLRAGRVTGWQLLKS